MGLMAVTARRLGGENQAAEAPLNLDLGEERSALFEEDGNRSALPRRYFPAMVHRARGGQNPHHGGRDLMGFRSETVRSTGTYNLAAAAASTERVGGQEEEKATGRDSSRALG